MPLVRPFRALRYASHVVPDLGAVTAPPYDVISPDERRRLAARDPHNVVRLDLPSIEPGDEPDDEYRRAARLLAVWRSDGVLLRDPRPSLYPYEQTYTLPGSDEPLVRQGVFATVGLEAFGRASGVRAHERTLHGPKEDRYRLLRATGVNTSPVVGLYEDPSGAVAAWLEAAVVAPPIADLVDDDGVRHRLWMAPDADLEGGETVGQRIGASPITIADGHHRYETALRYRDERRTGAVPGDEPAWERILMLLLEPIAGPLTVLATHRVVRDLGADGLATLRTRLPALFEVTHGLSAVALGDAFAASSGAEARGRIGLWTRDGGGALLRAREAAFEPLLPAGGRALHDLEVTRLGVALEHLLGIDAAAVDGGGRIAYTKDAGEAIRWVDEHQGGADAAFLLEPTPAAAIAAVADDGDVMPQKSTYIYPKALTGLVINPLE